MVCRRQVMGWWRGERRLLLPAGGREQERRGFGGRLQLRKARGAAERPVLRCAECAAEATGLAKAWHAFISGGFEGEPLGIGVFCPDCAKREVSAAKASGRNGGGFGARGAAGRTPAAPAPPPRMRLRPRTRQS